ncbi:aminopeptidase P family protein [Candidatus Odyssella thessalonicensis]|uniref:aminopeptidase P family protein n=1 Tax=Candidatus Odyssella thessalonicensis TaxID=84647 RepID=UPI000225AE9F|nr:aminopeptidase P family protein [Candidatus Odyssella thessalonicensis]
MTLKITSLQALLKQKNLDCFIVPRSDRYQGEYVVEADERLAWLTDFTGSAGLALVFHDHIALFVDGRYSLQAKQQVNLTYVKVIAIADCKPSEYVKNLEIPLTRIGFDPWLMSDHDFTGWSKNSGLQFVPCDSNPIDELWSDQPDRPLKAVEVHDLAYAGQPHTEKLAHFYDKLVQQEVEAALVMSPDNLCWLLNCRGSDFPYSPLVDWFAFVIKGQGVRIFCDERKIPASVHLHLQEVATFHPLEDLDKMIEGLAGKRTLIDPKLAPVIICDKLANNIVRAVDPLELMKACKADQEIEGICQAHLQDGVALTKFLAWLDTVPQDTETELSIAEKLEHFRQEADLYKGPSFPTIAGFAENGAIVHYRATPQSAKTIDYSSLLLVDSGGQYLNGTTDVTRTICLGEPTSEQKTNFTLVLQGHIKLAMTLFPEGTTGAQLDVLARYNLWQYGLDYDHGTGHGVGYYLNVHEGPQRISKAGSQVSLRPGMILSNEPGYYKENAYGIRIENLVTVKRIEGHFERPMLGFETLTLAPIDRRLIDETLLTSAEWEWLNQYHAKVRETLLPYLDPDTASWLIEATAEL